MKIARLILAATLALACTTAAYSTAKVALMASVVTVEGAVETQKAGQTVWKPAKAGMLLSAGDAIRTKAGGNCVLKWSQGNIVKMIPFTSLKVEKMDANPNLGSENTSLLIASGKMYAKAKPLNGKGSSFEVKTPTAVAAVRGTKFSVGMASEDETNVECLSGSVAVRGAGGAKEVLLREKQATVVKKDQSPSQPTKMNDNQLQQFDSIKEVAAPALDITSPAGNVETDKSEITVSGRTEPGAAVSVNGKAAAADSSGAFSVTISLTAGDNAIKIDSTNKQGKAVSASRNVKYLTPEMIAKEKAANANSNGANTGGSNNSGTGTDSGNGTDATSQTTAAAAVDLQLMVTSPGDGLVTRDSTITVSGTVSPSGDVYINDAPAGSSQSGPLNFSQVVPLPMEGDNTIKITAKNGSSTRSIIKKITKHSMPPMLTIVQPGGSQFSVGTGGCMLSGGNVQCNIIGVTSPGVKLTINGMGCSGAAAGGTGSSFCSIQSDGTFNATVQLGFNDTTITITAEDVVGNRTSQVLTRAIDTNRVSYLTMTVDRSSIVADNVSFVNITVSGMNLLKQPLDGIAVTLTATGGSLSPPPPAPIILHNGIGTATLRAGTTAGPISITASAGDASANASVLLTPDIPPIRNQK